MISDPNYRPNPWVWSANDRFGRGITITVPWNASTKALQAGEVVREADCELSKIIIGVGPDGSPDTSADIYQVPFGTTAIPANRLRQNSLKTIDDIWALQITAAI